MAWATSPGAGTFLHPRVLPDTALWLVFLAGCASRSPLRTVGSVAAESQPVAVSASGGATPVPGVVPASPPPTVETAAPSPVATVACTATLRAAFHLRPHMTVRSTGPEVAAGSRVVVLSTSTVSRGGSSGPAPVLSRVRVIATGVEGYAFVHPRELGPECPLLPDRYRHTPPLRDRIGGRRPRSLDQDQPLPEAPLTTTWRWPFDATRDRVLARVDIDRNGSLETVIWGDARDGGNPAVVLLREGVGGPVGIVVAEVLYVGENFTSSFATTIVTGGVVYVAMEESHAGCRHCLDASCASTSYALYRLHPDGWFVSVGSVPQESQGERLRVRGEGDGTLAVEGETTHRRASLRFDPTAFLFVTDAPVLPEDDGARGEDFCRRD